MDSCLPAQRLAHRDLHGHHHRQPGQEQDRVGQRVGGDEAGGQDHGDVKNAGRRFKPTSNASSYLVCDRFREDVLKYAGLTEMLRDTPDPPSRASQTIADLLMNSAIRRPPPQRCVCGSDTLAKYLGSSRIRARMSTDLTSVSSKLERVLRHGRSAKGAPVYAQPIRPYPISRHAGGIGSVSARDWVAAPSPDWVAEYESADWRRRSFMVGFKTPPEIPAAVLPTVERHKVDWLFCAWRWEATGAQLQWVSPSYRSPFAGWQIFFLQGTLAAIRHRRRIASKTAQWLLRGVVAVGLAVGGPLAAWWLINHLLAPK